MIPICDICNDKLIKIENGKKINVSYKECINCKEIWCTECTDCFEFLNLKCIIIKQYVCDCEPPCDCKLESKEIIYEFHEITDTSF